MAESLFIQVFPQPALANPNVATPTFVNSVAATSQTLTFSAFAWIVNAGDVSYPGNPFGVPLEPQPTFTFASSNTGIATINSSTGVATGVSAGICSIEVTCTISGTTYSGSGLFGVALISPASATVSPNSTQAFTCVSPAQWASGNSNLISGILPDTSDASASSVTAYSTGNSGATSIYAAVGGSWSGPNVVIAQASVTVS